MTRTTAHLKKQLGAGDLIGFGIGVVIGTGIFTLTGVEARTPPARRRHLLRDRRRRRLLAALCYAELASSVPTAGSAYSYAYATAGEVFAWIIGWDLFLEFALGAAVVARGWSGYVGNLFDLPTSLFGEDAPVNVGAVADRRRAQRDRRRRHPGVRPGHRRPGDREGRRSASSSSWPAPSS